MEKKTIIADSNPAFHSARRTSADCYSYMVKIFCLLLIFIAGCEREVVPQQLIGTWKTSDPQYADRYLKISEQTIIYGIGNDGEVSHTIDKIGIKHDGDKTVYTFYYRDSEGEKATLTVFYRSDSGGTFQLKNDKIIWQKLKQGDSER